MSSLEEVSDIIKRQGEERRQKQEELLSLMRERLPLQKTRISEMPNEELVKYCIAASGRGCVDPRETVLWQEVAGYAETEILRRMALTTTEQ